MVSLSLAPSVFIGVREGFVFAFAGSGKAMSSIICSMSASAILACSFRLDGRCGPFTPLPASFRIFINDAGVAGALSIIGEGTGTGCEAGCFAARYGDLLADMDLGVAGGGISISDNGSGDIDSASELSWLYGKGSFPSAVVGRALSGFDLRASSIIPATSLGGMVVLDDCFLRF